MRNGTVCDAPEQGSSWSRPPPGALSGSFTTAAPTIDVAFRNIAHLITGAFSPLPFGCYRTVHGHRKDSDAARRLQNASATKRLLSLPRSAQLTHPDSGLIPSEVQSVPGGW